VNDAPRRVLQVLRGAAEAPLVASGPDGTDAGGTDAAPGAIVTTVVGDDLGSEELLEQIFAADVVFVV
jgi:hypothetical protein